MGAVSIEHVGLAFGSQQDLKIVALENLSLEVPDKQFAVIVGPSGCGKSSLLDLIAGLREPTSGRCLLDGKPVGGPGADRGMVFQNYSLFPWLSVQKNVEFGLSLKRMMNVSGRNGRASMSMRSGSAALRSLILTNSRAA